MKHDKRLKPSRDLEPFITDTRPTLISDKKPFHSKETMMGTESFIGGQMGTDRL